MRLFSMLIRVIFFFVSLCSLLINCNDASSALQKSGFVFPSDLAQPQVQYVWLNINREKPKRLIMSKERRLTEKHHSQLTTRMQRYIFKFVNATHDHESETIYI